ncbi:basic salivary proline-rich protein 1-like [Felis catus]|uniref:basic salivary proline-rich protein 1-like n=1 Tax=Felis catus TaxID=9685 RepID=UPI001D19AB8E|nr:basic salivary proline-rich protein 1-like [Felis catus]
MPTAGSPPAALHQSPTASARLLPLRESPNAPGPAFPGSPKHKPHFLSRSSGYVGIQLAVPSPEPPAPPAHPKPSQTHKPPGSLWAGAAPTVQTASRVQEPERRRRDAPSRGHQPSEGKAPGHRPTLKMLTTETATREPHSKVHVPNINGCHFQPPLCPPPPRHGPPGPRPRGPLPEPSTRKAGGHRGGGGPAPSKQQLHVAQEGAVGSPEPRGTAPQALLPFERPGPEDRPRVPEPRAPLRDSSLENEPGAAARQGKPGARPGRPIPNSALGGAQTSEAGVWGGAPGTPLEDSLPRFLSPVPPGRLYGDDPETPPCGPVLPGSFQQPSPKNAGAPHLALTSFYFLDSGSSQGTTQPWNDPIEMPTGLLGGTGTTGGHRSRDKVIRWKGKAVPAA